MTTNMNTHTARGLLLLCNGHVKDELPVQTIEG